MLQTAAIDWLLHSATGVSTTALILRELCDRLVKEEIPMASARLVASRDPMIARRLFNVLDIGVGDEADLASYLLFDGAFCKQLIEMGRADAKARRDDLLAFFGDKSDDGGGLLEGDEYSGAYSAGSIQVPNLGT